MELQCRQVDSFTSEPFTGNPAAVCFTNQPLPETLMQQIALENNLSETAFLTPAANNRWKMRWFTPTVEVELCGHATLAAAHLLFLDKAVSGVTAYFDTLSGELRVTEENGLLWMELPVWRPEPVTPPADLAAILGCPVHAVRKGGPDLIVETETETAVRNCKPDFNRLKQIENIRAVSVTAPGFEVDFVSRCFAPAAGVNEDPVTGSAHCLLTPFWAERTGKSDLTANQISQRGGTLQCRLNERTVTLGGNAVVVKESRFLLPD